MPYSVAKNLSAGFGLTRKPQPPVVIDWQNPLTRDLWLCVPLQFTGRDLVSNLEAAYVGTNPSVDFVGEGISCASDATPSALEFDNGDLEAHGGELSIVAGVIPTTLTNDLHICTADNYNNAARQWQFRINGSGNVQFVHFSGGGATTNQSTRTVSANERVIVGGSYSLGSQAVYVDGVNEASSTVAGALDDDDCSITIGGLNRRSDIIDLLTTGEFIGIIEFVYIWRRGLSDDEQQQMFIDPHQILKPANNLVFFSSSSPADTDAPNVSLPTAASIDYRSVTVGATTDEDNGTAHAIITAAGDESAPTNQEIIDGTAAEALVVLNDKTISAAGAFTFDQTQALAPGTDYGYAIVHEDISGNEDAGSRVEGTFTTSAALSGQQTLTITTIPSNSIFWYFDGTHTGGTSATVLTDSNANGGSGWTVDGLIGLIVNNITDGSSDGIDDNTGTTATVSALTGGSGNDFELNDAYSITADVVTSDVLYYQPSGQVSSGQFSFDYYVYDASLGLYSDTVTATVTVSGAADGSGTISVDAEGVPTFTYSSGSSAAAIGDVIVDIVEDIVEDLIQ